MVPPNADNRWTHLEMAVKKGASEGGDKGLREVLVSILEAYKTGAIPFCAVKIVGFG